MDTFLTWAPVKDGYLSNVDKQIKIHNQSFFIFRELYEMVNRMANVLKSHDVKKGDVVCIYMPVSPLAVAAMLACARIGAPHRSV